MSEMGQTGLFEVDYLIPADGPISDIGPVGTKMFDFEKCCDLGVLVN